MCVVFLLAGCKTKKVVQMPNITTSPSSENVVSGIVINNLDFHTFSGRAKAAVEFGKERQDATLNVRINRSKAIWISVTASFLNIEAVRVLITPDSIKIMNKLQGEYIVKPFSYIHRYTGEGITFNILQNMLMSNVTNELLRTDQLTVAKAEDETQLVGVKDDISFQYSLSGSARPKVFRLLPVGSSDKLEVFYSSFNSVTGYEYPQRQNIKLHAAETSITVVLDYNKVEFNQEVEMPFTVPAKYKVIR